MRTDKELLDFLQTLNNEARYTGKCVLRISHHGRGWRLHESSRAESGAAYSVREAIDQFMDAHLGPGGGLRK